jgi:hypothetical protein
LRRAHVIVIYWLVALAVTVFLTVEMRRYVAIPSAAGWDRVARTIKQDWQPTDHLLFTPDWLAGYAMDRNRFKGTTAGERRIRDLEDAVPGTRVWVVHLPRRGGVQVRVAPVP